MLLAIVGSFLAALGFGVLFNIKGKNLVLAAIGGMLGAAIQGHVLEALTIGVETMAIAGILVLGILMVSTLMKAIFRPKKVSDAA